MASGAGLNRVGFHGGKPVLTCSGDGTYDSGIVMSEAMAFSKWVFQIIPTQSAAPSGWSVTCYGTIDPKANELWEQYFEGGWGTTSPLTLLPATSWFQIVSQSTETSGDTAVWSNPLTASGQHLYTPVPFVAVRVVAVGTSTNSTGITVLAFAVP